MSVRSKAIVAALVVAVVMLTWNNCQLARERRDAQRLAGDRDRDRDRAGEPTAPPVDPGGAGGDRGDTGGLPPELFGPGERPASVSFTVQSLLRFARPRPGETMLEYRDRLIPIAQAAVAPQRRRVADAFDAFAADAALTAGQRAEIEAIVDRAGSDIQDRVMQGVLSGELMPANVKPSTGVSFARDVLDMMDGANTHVRAVLTDDQLAALDAGRFDVVDYLVFSTRWEDMLGVIE